MNRPVSPEWVIAPREDRELDDTMIGGWQVTASPLTRGSSFTDFSQHRMAVPEGESPAAQAVRVHEMIHASISPTRVPGELLAQVGLTPEAVTLAEEVRVNCVAKAMALNASLRSYRAGAGLENADKAEDGTEAMIAKQAFEREDWRTALTVYLSTVGMEVNGKVRRFIRRNPDWKKALDVVEKRLTDYAMNPRKFAAHEAESMMKYEHLTSTKPVRYIWQRRIGERTVGTESSVLPLSFIRLTLPLAEMITQWLNNPPSKTDGPMKPRTEPLYWNSGAMWDSVQWGMTNLTEGTRRFVGRRKRPAITGKHPRRPDRLLTDPERRVFSESVRGIGGVVVFDCSGSMSVTYNDVLAVVREYAGATVVAYTNRERGQPNAWVLARNGRMISPTAMEKLPFGHGNGIDLPMLRWAVRQKRTPKDFVVWVSDGGVTGKGDHFDNGLLVETAAFCVRHNIIGAEHAPEAIALLQEAKRRGGFPRQKHCRRIGDAIRQLHGREE